METPDGDHLIPSIMRVRTPVLGKSFRRPLRTCSVSIIVWEVAKEPYHTIFRLKILTNKNKHLVPYVFTVLRCACNSQIIRIRAIPLIVLDR